MLCVDTCISNSWMAEFTLDVFVSFCLVPHILRKCFFSLNVEFAVWATLHSQITLGDGSLASSGITSRRPRPYDFYIGRWVLKFGPQTCVASASPT